MMGTVYIVHCIDAEGPLDESLSATFERINSIFGLNIEPSRTTLQSLQRKEIDLGGIEDDVACVVSPHVLGYKPEWGSIDAMLDRIMAPEFRKRLIDSFGGGWIYNWHCVAHVGYSINPRRRDIGWHNVFDRYRERITEMGGGDGLHFHFHPMPFSRQANHNASHWFANDLSLFELLARRIIERNWFPCVNRPGFHLERADSHWFLEQFIPFDYANQALAKVTVPQPDMAHGRWGDWRRAPATWQPYHPAHDDYQTFGDCRRWIMRCLNIGTRKDLLQQDDVNQAFAEARDGKPSILAFTNHDFREMSTDVDEVRVMLAKAQHKFPSVKFRYCEAAEAMRLAMGLDNASGRLDLSFSNNRIDIKASRPTFGPQPFLAIKTKSGEFIHDNLDNQIPFKHWTYHFDDQTIPVRAVEKIGLGTAFPNGTGATAVLDMKTQQTHHTVL